MGVRVEVVARGVRVKVVPRAHDESEARPKRCSHWIRRSTTCLHNLPEKRRAAWGWYGGTVVAGDDALISP